MLQQEDILRAAAEVVRKGGEKSLSARSIARELGCSTQPVYTLFHGMDELRRALREEAKARYRATIDRFLSKEDIRYRAFGMGFVKFAAEEKGLFRFLFLGENPSPDPFFGDIVGEMMRQYRMDEETALSFHADMSVFSFGLAVLVNGNSDALTEEQISDAFTREFLALYAFYFPDRPRFWEEQDEHH